MIELQDVVVAYADRVILDHVNLTIEDGETLVVLGGSGAGKSTILRLIIGLQRPNSGRILVDGVDVVGLSDDEFNKVREKMGMVFQYSALFDSMTVAENVAFGLRQHTELTNSDIQDIVQEKLDLVGLPDTGSFFQYAVCPGTEFVRGAYRIDRGVFHLAGWRESFEHPAYDERIDLHLLPGQVAG